MHLSFVSFMKQRQRKIMIIYITCFFMTLDWCIMKIPNVFGHQFNKCDNWFVFGVFFGKQKKIWKRLYDYFRFDQITNNGNKFGNQFILESSCFFIMYETQYYCPMPIIISTAVILVLFLNTYSKHQLIWIIAKIILQQYITFEYNF